MDCTALFCCCLWDSTNCFKFTTKHCNCSLRCVRLWRFEMCLWIAHSKQNALQYCETWSVLCVVRLRVCVWCTVCVACRWVDTMHAVWQVIVKDTVTQRFDAAGQRTHQKHIFMNISIARSLNVGKFVFLKVWCIVLLFHCCLLAVG